MPVRANIFSALMQKPSAPQWLIVGLGNPGDKYSRTRHNAGFMAIDALAQKHGIRIDKLKFHALIGSGTIDGVRVILAKPQTYMNESGRAVSEIASFYKLPPERILVMLDDISLEPGVMRIRRKGSDGGQKGMRDIIELLGSQNIPRIKLGVGAKPHPDYNLADWVLSSFTQSEKSELDKAIERAVEAATLIINDKIDQAMNKFSK